MALIFFDGFIRSPLDAHYWTPTGVVTVYTSNPPGPANGYITFTHSNPVTNNLKLGNIGTHTNKKLYLGIRLINYAAQNNSPFIRFYNSDDEVVLELKWNFADVTYPNIGIQAVVEGVGTLSPFVVLNSIAGAGWLQSGGDTYFFNASRVLEFEFDLTAGTLAVMYNGQALQTVSSSALLSLGEINFEVASVAVFGGTLSGYDGTVEDIYLVDNSGSFANTWLGENFRIHPTQFNSSAPANNTNWAPVPAGSGVNILNTSNGDADYFRTNVFDAEFAGDTNNISPTGVSPVVAGIRASSVSRGVLLDAAYKYLYRNQTASTNHEMGTRIVLDSSNYALQPAQFITLNPDTEAQWTVAEINAGAFGAKSVDPA